MLDLAECVIFYTTASEACGLIAISLAKWTSHDSLVYG